VRHGLLDGGQPSRRPLPDTSFLLCRAPPPVAEILDRLRVPNFLHMYASLQEALDAAAAAARPPYLRDELRLAPTPTAPAAARAFVREVCGHWRLARPGTTVTDRVVLLANELVTNAVAHAHTEIRLRLELRGDRLHIAVRDGGPGLPHVVAPDWEAEGGRGLWLVEQLARSWGVNRHPDGGKVVWCVLSL
jgi:anti-sigma regulatory factor (Ser/Thr protein kinase)